MKRLEQTRRGVRITTKNGFHITARRAVIAAGFESKALLHGEAGTLLSIYALISQKIRDGFLGRKNRDASIFRFGR